VQDLLACLALLAMLQTHCRAPLTK
jgi:hypothetical protein